MADFKATNEMENLVRLFLERNKYYGKALEKSDGTRQDGIMDINSFERVYYGRCDDEMNTILPKENRIKGSTDPRISDDPVSGLDIAVKAFENFASDIRFDLVTAGSGIIDTDPYLSVIKCYRSYSDIQAPAIRYNQHIMDLNSNFLQYLKKTNNNNSIANFQDFVNIFLSFFKQTGGEIPFTPTCFHKSNLSNVFASGLAFSVADLDCGNDVQKTTFLNSPNFNVYKNRANRRGFYLSLQCPWIMIYNPRHKHKLSTLIRQEYGIFNRLNAIEASYDKVYLNDINEIKRILIRLYNIYIEKFSYRYEITYENGRTKKINHQREPINKKNVVVNDLPLFLFYIDVRNIEEGSPYPPADLQRIKEKATFFYKKLDKETSLSYINDQFRSSFALKPGSLVNFLQKITEG